MSFRSLSNPWIITICLPIAVLVCGCAPEPKSPKPPVSKEVAGQLNEANQHFTYHGKPIAPKAVDDLTAWVSDQFSGPVAIDLEANESNRYFGDIERKDGWLVTEWQEGESKSSFGYQYTGRLANGYHVLHTAKNDGGSGTFESLLVIRFSIEGTYVEDKGGIKVSYRIVMHQAGEIALGDRSGADLKIKGNSVLIDRSGMPVKEIRF